MWKYVSRRIRDNLERGANHFDRCSATVANSGAAGATNFSEEKKSSPCCKWFAARRCRKSFENDNNTNGKKWNFEHLNKSWMDAITWSGALVLGWYTSQLIHLRLKAHLRGNQNNVTVNDLFASIQPYLTCGKKDQYYLKSTPKISEAVLNFAPTVQLVSNDHTASSSEKSIHSGSSHSQDSSDDDLGEVLNSIENRLGLAAIENGQYQDGLSLLRSAANRNHAPALYNLGLCYENGLGVSTNEKTAMELYKAAATLKHPGALYNLGIFYGQGRGGLKSDQEIAKRLLRLAAVQGQQDAIDALKVLDVTIEETPTQELNMWSYQQSPYFHNENIIPAQTKLFFENMNYLQLHKCEATY